VFGGGVLGEVRMNIIVALDDGEFVAGAVEALRSSGFMAIGCTEPYEAAQAIDRTQQLDLLVGRVASSGLVLARIAKLRHPGLQVLLAGDAFHTRLAFGAGETIPWPITETHLVRLVRRLFDPSVISEHALDTLWQKADGLPEATRRPGTRLGGRRDGLWRPLALHRCACAFPLTE
jgi:hypothetical protein